MRLSSLRTTAALVAALVTTLAGQTPAPPADAATAHAQADSVAINAVGAEAMYGSTWTEPGPGWRGALTRSGPTVPRTTVEAQDDKPDYYSVDGCHASKTETRFKPCVLGDKDGSKTWLVVGSSKAGTWVDPLAAIAAREGARLEVATRSTTPFTPGMGSGSGRTYNDAGLAYIQKHRPDAVLLTLDQPADFTVRAGDAERIIDQVRAAGSHVAVLWNPAGATPSPMACLEDGPSDYRTCDFQFGTSEQEMEAANRAGFSDDISYISVEDWVAPEGTGHAVIGGVVVPGRGSHLTATYARSLELPLASEMHESGLVENDPDAVTRIAGANRYETAARLAMRFQDPMTVYVTSGTDYPDALAAGTYSGGWDRTLLTRPGSLPRETREAMPELGTGLDTQYVIVGGGSAVSANVESQLRARATKVTRIAGGNRYETAAQMALQQADVGRVFLTSGTGWADAVSVGAVAQDGDALLLTKPGQLPQATSAALSALDPSEVVIVGGTGAVSGGITAQVRAAVPGASVTRVAGDNRYETAAALAEQYGDLTGNVLIATGADFADALSAGQLGLWGAGLVTTILVNVGINLRTARLDRDSADLEQWRAMRSRWEIFQAFRSWVYLLGFVVVSVAVVSG